MPELGSNIYQDIAQRTGGDIYIGVIGPVRTGKSTFVKRVMETLVIPNIDNVYQRERAKDELPQSGSGKTVMTAEPKFVPEESVTISPDGTAALSVRMIDSVGYMVPGAIGAEEDGKPRMVTTPWYPQEIPMCEAAELGTKRIMEEHCSIGILITTDGSFTDIPREDYEDPECRAIEDMKATGKPFVILVNSAEPESEKAKKLTNQLQKKFDVTCRCVNCLTLQEKELCQILNDILCEFPVEEIKIWLPDWFDILPIDHKLKTKMYDLLQKTAGGITRLREGKELQQKMEHIEFIENVTLISHEPGTGTLNYKILMPMGFFHDILKEETGLEIQNNGDILRFLRELSRSKNTYDQVGSALEQVQATGYGIVMPSADEMLLEAPQIIRKGSSYGVKLKASAPSIHMIRADIETEISPMVGDEKQSEELLHYLLREYEDNTQKLWQSNIFGKSVYELVSEGLNSKLNRMPEDARGKLKGTLTKIINEGGSGLLCIIFS